MGPPAVTHRGHEEHREPYGHGRSIWGSRTHGKVFPRGRPFSATTTALQSRAPQPTRDVGVGQTLPSPKSKGVIRRRSFDWRPSGGGPDNMETKELIEFLRRIVVDSEDALFLDEGAGVVSKKTEHKQFAKKSTKDPRQRSQVSTVAAVGAGAQPTRKQDKLPCLFCEVTDHRTSKCPADIAIEKRRRILQKLRKCTKCFRPKHQTASECNGPRFPCNGMVPVHVGVCKSPKRYTSMHVGSAPNAASRFPSSPISSAAAARPDPASGFSSTMMLTASAFIVNGGRRTPVRLFFDVGSSVTFIAPHIRRLIRDETPLYRATMAIRAVAGQRNFRNDK